MCTVLLPPGDNPIAVNKYIISYHTILSSSSGLLTNRLFKYIIKFKAVPLQAWSGPDGSRKLRSPDFMTTAQDGGKVVSLTHQPPLTPGDTPGTHFC